MLLSATKSRLCRPDDLRFVQRREGWEDGEAFYGLTEAEDPGGVEISEAPASVA
jgi:hypothetical protein